MHVGRGSLRLEPLAGQSREKRSMHVLWCLWLVPVYACDDCGLDLLQRRGAKLSKLEVNASDEGKIFMIYTYGAVATSHTPLEDLSQPSKTFRGLRCFTENLLLFNVKQTDAGANLNKLYHSKVALAAA